MHQHHQDNSGEKGIFNFFIQGENNSEQMICMCLNLRPETLSSFDLSKHQHKMA